MADKGIFGLTKGLASTLIGYSLQGFEKFAFYGIFKTFYGEIFGKENAHVHRTIIYLLARASPELFADIALAPWQAIKVRVQTQDNSASTLRQSLPKFYVNFACLECTTEVLNKYIIRKPREQHTKAKDLSITFIAGYIAGIFCAIVSYPADTIASELHNEKVLVYRCYTTCWIFW
ncbi:unnamed protein product [Rotaria sp. Silwood1]|nr:unnamed protein product [Rotaria sp. Silwood1]CAF3346819.1 unnamed protein product [Rotaria sp. Silwood1]CAF3370695.1 unnamed protein product [Rotaria sp. Silwood1]CAF4909136.1 unnamed protein product [Rotaria sp. Silwood1]CAF4932712.1 unnamed protein product [Rotaria sp. Silwood1]